MERDSRFEALERRVVLDGHLTNVLYYPEGFTSANVNEYVPITNPNDVAVEFELHARYEWGERDALIARGTIAPRSRDGVTISEITRPDDRLVRTDVPYALVLRSTMPLAATLSHYDFGTAVGESFVATTGPLWSFADGRKDSAGSRDFILVFNPNATVANVTLTVMDSAGGITTRSIVVEAERRAGWSLDDIPGIAPGAFAATVVSDVPIVAAQSHYELESQRGYGLIGTVGGGSLAGVLPTIDFDDSFYEINGDEPSGVRFEGNAFVSIVNPNGAPATVTLTFLLDESGSGDPPPIRRVAIVPAQSRSQISIRDLGVAQDVEIAVVYRSNVPVTVSGSVYQGRDGTGFNAATQAATTWDFGEGFMSRSRAGREVEEDIYVFNPTSQDVSVTVTFFMLDGTTRTISDDISSLEVEDIKIHELAEFITGPENQFFGFRVTSPSPIVASVEHWDGSIGGGFSTFGMPRGTVVDLASVLAI
ncbi:MAG: DUF5719 family protein [Planctomycetota bacterium]|nr:DUF5719 family protein [Planctomycetota bacterium]